MNDILNKCPKSFLNDYLLLILIYLKRKLFKESVAEEVKVN